MSFVRDLAALLRLHDFRRLFAVRLLSQSSDGVFQVALATYVVFSPEEETSAAGIASAMAVLLLPYSLLGPFTGVLLDRWRRRQALLYCNLLRAALSVVTAVLLIAEVPDWLFYASALAVTAVNRFVLAGLSAALPRVVPASQLVMANSVFPTAGTVAATLGGSAAFAVPLLLPEGADADAVVVLIAALLYVGAALAARRIPVELLGPDVQPRVRPAVGTAVLEVLRAVRDVLNGLVAGLRQLRERLPAAHALAAMAAMRFCYGALTVTVLMLCRYAFTSGDGRDGMALLGAAVACSGAGFFVAALVTPAVVRRLRVGGWIAVCAAGGAVLLPSLGLSFQPVPVLVAAFLLGLVTQGAKIATDTVVQHEVADAFRGRVFSLYDVLFNVAFVGAAAVAAVVLPEDGRSRELLLAVAALYALTAAAYGTAAGKHPPRVGDARTDRSE